MTLNSIYVDNLIKTALLEDINYLDTTTDYLIDENQERQPCGMVLPSTGR